MTPKPNVRYITAKLAQQIDEELMSSSGAFSLDQLMELAGLSCAQALAKSFPLPKYRRVLVCCGPGNQGGDGLVAARHLHHLSYSPTVFLPKPGKKDIYQRLLKQCENLDIKVLKGMGELEGALKESDVVMDAIFGFSFQPPLRPPFHTILTALRQSSLPIISIDIPSGWDVERGRQRLETVPDEKTGEVEVVETFEPEVLVSLTVPKLGVEQFGGRHWLGGRFVPGLWNEGRVEEHCAGASIVCACVQGDLAQKYELNIPPYEGLDQVVELPRRSVKE